MQIKTTGGGFMLDAYGLHDVVLRVPLIGEFYASTQGIDRGRRFFDAWRLDHGRGFVLFVGKWSLEYNAPPISSGEEVEG